MHFFVARAVLLTISSSRSLLNWWASLEASSFCLLSWRGSWRPEKLSVTRFCWPSISVSPASSWDRAKAWDCKACTSFSLTSIWCSSIWRWKTETCQNIHSKCSHFLPNSVLGLDLKIIFLTLIIDSILWLLYNLSSRQEFILAIIWKFSNNFLKYLMIYFK